MEPRTSGPFPYSPIVGRPKLEWPGNARLALWVIPNIEVFALDDPLEAGTGMVPDVPNHCYREYGARVGVWRIMEVLSRYGIRGTVALNSNVCDAYPQIIDECLKLGWELMGHNHTNTRRLNKIPPEQEREVVLSTLDRIERASGKRPAGWLSSGLQETWNTLDYLIEGGCLYVADWVNDDQPYVMDLTGKRILSVPYSFEINDIAAYERHNRTPEQFEAMIRRQFDVLYREGAESGRVMAIALHPYLTGIPHRIGALDSALAYICAHEGVWLTTGEEIASHYLEVRGDR